MIEIKQFFTKCPTQAEIMLTKIIFTTIQSTKYYYSIIQKRSDHIRRFQFRILSLKIKPNQQKYIFYFNQVELSNLPIWKDKIPRSKKELDLKLIENIDYSQDNAIVFNFKKSCGQKQWYIKFNNQELRAQWSTILRKITDQAVKKSQQISRQNHYAIQKQDLYVNQKKELVRKQRLWEILQDRSITLQQKYGYFLTKQTRIRQLQNELARSKQKENHLQQKYQNLQKTNSDLFLQLQRRKQNQNQLLNKMAKEKQDEILVLNAKITELGQSVREKTDQIQILSKQIERLSQQKKDLQQKYASLNHQYQKLNAKYIETQSVLTKNNSNYEQISKLYKAQLNLRLFSGNILDGDNYNKEFLKLQIQSYVKFKVYSTKLIYRYDELNKVNFHKYLDYIDNLLFLVKLKNLALVAAFTMEGFNPKKNTEKGGLIISLTNKKSFELIKGHRAIQYDDYYIIFGNSQIRIKSQQSKLFSNFAINNAFYANKGEKVDVLLCADGLREIQILEYQFYQIKFQE